MYPEPRPRRWIVDLLIVGTLVFLLGESYLPYSHNWHTVATIVLGVIFFSLTTCWVYVNQGVFEVPELPQRTPVGVLQEEQRDEER